MSAKDAPIRVLVDMDQAIGFNRSALAGIAHAAHARGKIILDLRWGNTPMSQASSEQFSDGIITASPDAGNANWVLSTGLPSVNVANFVEYHSKIPVVGNDDEAVGQMAADFYLDRGYKCFAYVYSGENSYFNVRRNSFRKRVEDAGYKVAVFNTRLARGQGKNAESGRVRAWASEFPGPVGVLCPFDNDARVLVHSATLAGLSVPDQISVIGVDNDANLCLTTTPGISSVETAAARIGEIALDVLLSLIDGDPFPEKPILVRPTSIVERGSTGELGTGDADITAAVTYMRSHLSERLSIGLIAEQGAISQRTLERKFIHSIGRSPLQELRRLRIERAKRLLMETDLELKEVARQSGLIHVQRLSRLIREATGFSPARFRHLKAANETALA